MCIGIVTAIIGDVASHFGCTLGIKDSVTAIVFVALGTSIPGMQKYHISGLKIKYSNFMQIKLFFTLFFDRQIRSQVKWQQFRISMQTLVLEM